jgi:hypothetical protein
LLENTTIVDVRPFTRVAGFGLVHAMIGVTDGQSKVFDEVGVIIQAIIGVFVEAHGPCFREVEGHADTIACVDAFESTTTGLTNAKSLAFQRKAITVVTGSIDHTEVFALHRLAEFSKSNHSIPGTSPTDTDLIVATHRAAFATVGFVCFGIDALSTTERLTGGAGADATVASLTSRTAIAAFSTMNLTCFEVVTLPATGILARRTNDSTASIGTTETRLANLTALATMGIVCFEIDTTVVADAQASLTTQRTFAIGTELTGSAGISTRSTVGVVCFEVGTLTTTDNLTCGAGDRAGSIGAQLTGFAGGPAFATVSAACFQINTGAIAVGQTARTGTLPANTVFATRTSGSTFATVIVVEVGIDTSAIADRGSGRRTEVLTLALVTDLSVSAGFSTSSTVRGAGLSVCTLSTTDNLTDGAGTVAIETTLIRRTGLPTLATVVTVGFGVDTGAGANGGNGRRTGILTLSGFADLPGFAEISTFATMSAVALDIDTGTIAIGLTAGTGNFALTIGTDFAGFADSATLAAVSAVSLNIDTRTIAIGATALTRENTGAARAHLTSFADGATLATVASIGVQDDTGAIAIGLPAWTGDFALTTRTNFTGFTNGATLAAMSAIVLHIDAGTGAIGLSAWTGDFAFAIGADFARFADGATLATMSTIRLDIDTGAVAIGLSGFAGESTFAIGADFTRSAGIAASSAIGLTDLKVDTGFAANGQTFATRESTGTFFTDLTGITDIATLATVSATCLKVKTTTIANILTGGAGDCTFAIGADFTCQTFVSAFSTVGAVSVEIRTEVTVFAVGLFPGTLSFRAFAFKTVLVAITGFFFCAPLITTLGVDNAAGKTTGELVHSSDTLALCILTDLWFRTIGDALVVFTFFVVFADFELFALTPGIVGFAGLCSLSATLSGLGSTLAGCSGLTDLAAIGQTDRLARIFGFALIVSQAINTTTFTFAVLAFRAVFVRATDTTIVRGTFLRGAGFALTMYVFQTGNTLPTLVTFVEQAAFWTLFTSGDGEIGFTRATDSQPEQKPHREKQRTPTKCLWYAHIRTLL